jgi:hypothetical protein
MYATPREAFRGWSRIFFGSLLTPRRLVISAASQLWYTIVPWGSLVVAAVVVVRGSGSVSPWWWALLGAAVFAVAAQQALLGRFYQLVHTPPAWSLLYVLGTVASLVMLGSALMQALGLRGTTWRGTTYQGASVVSDPTASATSATTVDSTTR